MIGFELSNQGKNSTEKSTRHWCRHGEHLVNLIVVMMLKNKIAIPPCGCFIVDWIF